MTKNIAVKVEHVSKYFKLPTESTQSLRTALVNRFKGIKGYKKQHVLRDINFEVEEGDFFGIVGRNGSGKSTLLKIISQIYVPEQGKATVNGKLVSFIELGVGFNPELTGKENVYLNGAMLGFTQKEIDDMYDDIVDFAELGEFMNQKLKNYSSGMQVRLAFSVAIKAQGDVLILDEVLAVGDEAFQRKCNDYFMERKKSGKTTILVTHDMSAVKKYCNKAVLIENGLVKAYGEPFDVAGQYQLDNTHTNTPTTTSNEEESPSKGELETNHRIQNLKAVLLHDKIYQPEDILQFEISYDQLVDDDTYLAFTFFDLDTGQPLYNDNSMYLSTTGIGKKTFSYECCLDYFNSIKVRMVMVVKNRASEILAVTPLDESPIVTIVRKIDQTDLSLVDSADGILKRQGTFKTI
ncbi:TPA: ABC transporter ATP-binding protein [Streptococcus suis]|uniref:ABC transporter ATP-binding protein n=1 Tax=Streptococcus suis TaxID=1307 RepID=A0A0Z8F2M2_STRSU|nr:ABC transporter ATP-binding protein [Streptococcus suis]MBL6504622.1 ABC transporter ATP-binding protein [Streptococcus suis]MBM0240874.1 ABC transporter ATP-binding protein [Streptococcus suis]MBM7204209.1 ABC transporter ATP-binding protein [Streptococcus suis]MBM7281182.1 ABC transporter ATP-binding protein [Streptococcus suis]MBO4116230.1 ABC transporter ATP-binding protein [Streptococcus suis]